MRWFFLIAMGIILVGCGSPTSRKANPSATVQSMQAFEATLYPIVKNRCQSCHGVSQSPLFAVSPVSTAHQNILSYINFSNPSLSRLSIVGGNGHCGSICSNATAQEIIVGIQSWNERLKEEQVQAPQLVTQSKAIPNLELASAVMSWDLDSFGYAGAKLFLTVEKFMDGVYRVKDLQLRTGSSSVAIARVRVLINGDWDPANVSFLLVEHWTAANISALSLSTHSMLVFAKNWGQDSMSLSFEEISPGCKNMSGYTAQIKPILENCRGCHDSSVAGYDVAAALAFDLNGNDSTRCFRARRRSEPSNLANSTLITFPLQGSPMFTTPQINSVQAGILYDWLVSEFE